MVGFPLTSIKARVYVHDREVGIPVTTAETAIQAVMLGWQEPSCRALHKQAI